MTPKYNTRRAFISLLPLLSSGGEGRWGTGYNSIPITLVGTVSNFFSLRSVFWRIRTMIRKDTANFSVPYISSSILLQTELGKARCI